MTLEHKIYLVLLLEREEIVNMQLRAARKASGKTQAQVAKESQISENQYQNIEYNKSEPSVRTAIRIAKALNSTVESLFGAATPDIQKEPDGNPAK